MAQLTVALRFASVEALAIASFQLAWQPRVFAMGTSDFALNRIAIDARRFLGLVAAAALALALVLPAAIPIVAGEPYRSAVPTAGWCLAATLLTAAYAMAATPSAIAKRPGLITQSTVAGIGIAVVANIVLAPRSGSVGTGAALVIGQAVALLVVVLRSRDVLPLPGPWLKSALALGATSVAIIAWTSEDLSRWASAFAVVIAGVALIADPTLRAVASQVLKRRSAPKPF